MIFLKPSLFQKTFVTKFKFLLIFFIIFFCSNNTFSEIIINGNQNISKNTINSFKPSNFNINNKKTIDEFQKNLFNSGFFKTIKIKIDNNNLYVYLVENPLVNFFYIDGNIKSELLKIIEKNISIKENDILRLHLIKSDLKSISSLLTSIGYLKNEVNYQLIELSNNKVNLFYNIKLNNKFHINRILFVGNKYFKSSTLKDVIYTNEHGWWKFLSNTTIAAENLVNVDILRLKKFYMNEGFYDAQVTSSSVSIINDKEVNIVYSIDSGEKYLFDNVIINNLSSSLNDKDLFFLKKIIKNLPNSYFSQAEIDNKINKINKFFTTSNLDLIVDYQLKKNLSNKINLTFQISDNPIKKTINKITFKGNDITEDFVIRNFLNISEGDQFNNKKLLNSIDQIKDSTLFKNVSYEVDDLDNDNLNILISVVEQPTGEISAGAGAGSNGATITGSITEKNFLGKGINLNTNANIGTEKIFGKISFSNPDFNSSGNVLNGSLYIESNDYTNANYENKIIGTRISTSYEIYDKIFFTPGYSIDYDQVKVSSSASSAVKRREGDFFTNKIFYTINSNTKDVMNNTKNGYNIGFSQGLSFLLSDIPYINNNFFGSYYNTYKDGFTGSIKYKIESINGFDENIKFSDRLNISSNNLRGFENRSIGPTIDNDYVGGNYSYYTNFSTTFPNGLPDKWNAITNIFYDVANVFGTDDDNINDSNKIRSSIGIGLSWVSPLGPISVSYAEPLSKSSTDNVEQFNFKIGSMF